MSNSAPGHGSRPEDPQCYNCGTKGHWAVACPEPTRETPAGLAAWRSSSNATQGNSKGQHQHGGQKRSNKGPIITKYAPPPSPASHALAQYSPPSSHAQTSGPPYPGAPPPFPPPFQHYPPPTHYPPSYPPPVYPPQHYPPPAAYGSSHIGPPGYAGPPPTPLRPAGPPGQASAYSPGYGSFPTPQLPDSHKYSSLPPYIPPYPKHSSYGPPSTHYATSGKSPPASSPSILPSRSPSRSKPAKDPVHHSLPAKPPPSQHAHFSKPLRENKQKRRQDRQNSKHRENRQKEQSSSQRSPNQKTYHGHNSRPSNQSSMKNMPSGRRRQHEPSVATVHPKSKPVEATPACQDSLEESQPLVNILSDSLTDEKAEAEVSLEVSYIITKPEVPHKSQVDALHHTSQCEANPAQIMHDTKDKESDVPRQSNADESAPAISDSLSTSDLQVVCNSTALPELSLVNKDGLNIADLNTFLDGHQAGQKRSPKEEQSEENEHPPKKLKTENVLETDGANAKAQELTESLWNSLRDTEQAQVEPEQELPPPRSPSRSRERQRRLNGPRETRNSSVSSRSSDLSSLEAELLGRPSRQRSSSDTDVRQRQDRHMSSKPKRRRRPNAESAYSRRW